MSYNVYSGGVIVVSAVRKRFVSHEVLRGVDLEVGAGEVVGLLGRNGAGKTTLIRIMSGLLASDAGGVMVGGVDVVANPAAVGAVIGLAPQELGLYPQLSARQNLKCFGEISGMAPRAAGRRADELLSLFGLESCTDQSALRLSGGQKRRLHTAVALMHRPSVLFLDEPTVGADVSARAEILNVVRGIADEGATVLYTTHYMPELERLDARIVVLSDGLIVADGPQREVIDRWARPSLKLRFDGASPEVAGWRTNGDLLEPRLRIDDPGAALAEVLSRPELRGARLRDVSVVRADLETAYLAILGKHDEIGEQDERGEWVEDVA